MHLWLVLGTRPEIVKLSPVIQRAAGLGLDFRVVHTGQHYDYLMDGVFFEELQLPQPSHHLHVGSASHARQTADIMVGTEALLVEHGGGIVLVQGDTNSTLGGALAAARLPACRVAHLEAGCRSFNRAMPEEVNRVLVDHVSDVLFAPTQTEVRNLAAEGIRQAVYLTGSTGLEACLRHKALARKPEALARYVDSGRDYAVLTVHRAESTHSPEVLAQILAGVGAVAGSLSVLWPMHPRTRRALMEAGLDVPAGVTQVEPLGYLEFLYVIQHARLVLTDSGGVQEEAVACGVPCVTLRNETEWTYTLSLGNRLAGTTAAGIQEATAQALSEPPREATAALQGAQPPSAIAVAGLLALDGGEPHP